VLPLQVHRLTVLCHHLVVCSYGYRTPEAAKSMGQPICWREMGVLRAHNRAEPRDGPHQTTTMPAQHNGFGLFGEQLCWGKSFAVATLVGGGRQLVCVCRWL
jgi:hypothetical protein